MILDSEILCECGSHCYGSEHSIGKAMIMTLSTFRIKNVLTTFINLRINLRICVLYMVAKVQ